MTERGAAVREGCPDAAEEARTAILAERRAARKQAGGLSQSRSGRVAS